MRIALDYDRTYSADPEFWDYFIASCHAHGHDVRIVTHRSPDLDRTAALVALEKKVKIIYTNGAAKAWYCAHFGGGFEPDVWIDDKPLSILHNSPTSPDDLAAWRVSRDEGVSFRKAT